jgi:polyphosphate kinase
MKNPAATLAQQAASGPAVDLDHRSLYINREVSWLAFNGRVLNEACSARWPLLERVKFLAIYASNLDEFFMIRVSGLHDQLEAAVAETSADGLTPAEQLALIADTVRGQLETASRLLSVDLLPALADAGVKVRDWSSLDPAQQSLACQYFRKSVFPVLTPLAVDPAHPFPFVSNLSLSLAVEVRDPETKRVKFARVKVPESLPRMVALKTSDPRRHELLPLEQLMSANLADLFPGMEIVSCHPFRVTRDMDIELLEDEADDLLSVVDRELRRRRFGAVVRLEVAATIPQRIRRMLVQKLEIDEQDVYESSGPLGLSALMSVAQLDRADLRDPPFVPRVPPELGPGEDPFAAIRARDILLHHPYDSFGPVLELLRRAAEDPEVLAIKMTLYRTGSNAEAVRALVRAAENGKQVAVSIEIKARFDEQNNITWARTLERAGAHVFFGQAGSKTHAKMVLVVRHERDGLRRYVHMSTGNYNASSARGYTDLGLFTADPEIGEDASELFNSLSGCSKAPAYRRLAVAPAGLRPAVLQKIEAQTARAKAGRPAAIFAKLNSLVDGGVIQALYRASQAGVSIDLCVRGVCCLRPGVPGVSENIRVTSVLGRFLEHERVLVFGPPGEEDVLLSSADWMPRNFLRRVEAMFPVASEHLREKIRQEVLAPLAADNAQAYDMRTDGTYVQRTAPEGQPAHAVQADVMERAARRPLQVVPPSAHPSSTAEA